MALKLGEAHIDYNTSSQGHQFHKSTFLYVTANNNVNSKFKNSRNNKRKLDME